jgi:hypothetical protein
MHVSHGGARVKADGPLSASGSAWVNRQIVPRTARAHPGQARRGFASHGRPSGASHTAGLGYWRECSHSGGGTSCDRLLFSWFDQWEFYHGLRTLASVAALACLFAARLFTARARPDLARERASPHAVQPPHTIPFTCGIPVTGCPPPTLISTGDAGRLSLGTVNVTDRLSPAFRPMRWNPHSRRIGAPSPGPPAT